MWMNKNKNRSLGEGTRERMINENRKILLKYGIKSMIKMARKCTSAKILKALV